MPEPIVLLAVCVIALAASLIVSWICMGDLRKRIETLDLHVIYLFKHQHDGRFELRRNTK